MTSLFVAALTAVFVTIPSDICPGLCAEAPTTPCGEAGDCASGACVFDDSCLPGGAFAIARVVPESETGLNDPSLWTPEGMPAVGVEDGLLTARLKESDASLYVIRTVTLTPGKRYSVRARLRADADAYGYLVAYSGDSYRADYATPISKSSTDWQTVALTLDAGTDTFTRVSFYGAHAGPSLEGGAVQASELALLELHDDFGIYLRVTLVSPAVDAFYGSPFITLIGGPYFYDNMLPEPVAASTATPWIDMRTRMPATFVSFGMQFTDDSGAVIAPAQMRYEVAYRPDEAAIVVDETVATANGSVGFVGSGYPNAMGFAGRLRVIADVVDDDPVAYRARPDFATTPQPEVFGSMSGTGWLPFWGPSESLVPVLEFWRDLGLNGTVEMSIPELEDTLEDLGLTYRYLNIGIPSVWLTPHAPYAFDTVDAELDTMWSSYPTIQDTFVRYADQPERLLLDLCDEAYGFYFAGDPTYHQAFRDFLKRDVLQCPDPADEVACTPAAFGKSDWNDVFGLTENDGGLDGIRPAPGDVAAGRYFYWRVRFWSEASARVYARTSQFFREKMRDAGGGDTTPVISPNLGTPMGSYYTWRGGLEMQTVLRHDMLTGFLGEAFVSWNDWCWGQQLSMYGDWVDGSLAGYDLTRRGSHLHFTRGSGAHKALALAAHGITLLDWYIYGPYQITTGDGAAGLGEPSLRSIAIMQDGTRALSIAEPALRGTTRVTGGIAIMASQSDPMWWNAVDDLWGFTQAISTDETGTYLALTHLHHPVTFLIEERLVDDLDATTRLLFVQRRHLDSRAFAKIQEWVGAGGTLVLVGELPTHDELGQAAPSRLTWLGTDAAPLEIFTPTYTVDFPGGPSVTSPYPRRVLTSDAGATTLATYGDGGDAVLEVTRGRGKIRIAGFQLGRTYMELASYCGASGLPSDLGYFPTYVSAVRDAVDVLVGDIASPASGNDPLVEVVRRHKNGTEVLVLLNYKNADLPDFQLHVPGVSGTAHARFADTDVVFDADGDATFPLSDVEVLELPVPLDEPDGPGSTPTPTGCTCEAGADPSSFMLMGAAVAALLLIRRRRVRQGGTAPGLALHLRF